MRRIAAVLFLALAAGCSAFDPHNILGRQPGEPTRLPTEVVPAPPSPTLGDAARAQAFDFVWTTIRDRYVDASLRGVDWQAVRARFRPLALDAADDDAFWDLLDRMVGELRDGHTRVESPKRAALRKRDEVVTLGISFAPVDGRLAITAVSPASDAWWAGVRPGMLLATMRGEPAAQAYAAMLESTRQDSTERSRHLRVVRRFVTGDEGSKETVGFERADGSRFEATLARQKVTVPATEYHRVLPSGFGYLRFTQWTVGVMPRVLDGLKELKDTPGLVIDLRGNPGGSVHAVNLLLGRFFQKRTEIGHATTRTGRPVSLLFGAVDIIKLKRDVAGDPDAYKGPVVILLNPQSASGSELFGATMQATGRAVVVGEPSCGCLLGFLGYATIPGGGELAYSEVGFVMSNGKRIEGEGVIPDHPVPPTLADLRLSRDRALEEAQALLSRMAAPRG